MKKFFSYIISGAMVLVLIPLAVSAKTAIKPVAVKKPVHTVAHVIKKVTVKKTSSLKSLLFMKTQALSPRQRTLRDNIEAAEEARERALVEKALGNA